MRSDKQTRASQTNGAKSKGPVTPEGKASSARNASRHNLCQGHLVLLSTEDPYEFHELQNGFLARFQPIDPVETDLVHRMIAATWREKRVTAMETALFEIEMLRRRPQIDDEFSGMTAPGLQILALFGTDDTQAASALLFRYGSTARGAYSAALRALKEIQGDRFNRSSPSAPAPQVHSQDNTQPGGTSQHQHVPPPPPAFPTAGPRNAGLATFVVLRRRLERLVSGENAVLPNEPKRALAAGQSTFSRFAQL